MVRVTYNSQLQPPAPFLFVSISHPVTGDTIANVPAQLDTAADRTLIPHQLATSLELTPIDSILIGGIGGSIEKMPIYAVLLGVLTSPQRTQLWLLIRTSNGFYLAATYSIDIASSSMAQGLRSKSIDFSKFPHQSNGDKFSSTSAASPLAAAASLHHASGIGPVL